LPDETPATPKPTAPAPGEVRRATPLAARGEPLIWLASFTLAAAILMVVGLVGLIIVRGGATFWPTDLVLVAVADRPDAPAKTYLGQWTRSETRRANPEAEPVERRMLYVANADLYGHAEVRRWIDVPSVVSSAMPEDAAVFERLGNNGPFIGFLKAVRAGDRTVAPTPAEAWAVLEGTGPNPVDKSDLTAELADAGGRTVTVKVTDIVRAFRPNRLGFWGRLAVYGDRWREFLTADPRAANTEGGVFPALFGTVMMTLILAVAVAPFGVIAALYLREYAKQGLVVSIIRIAVNNLAGVPSVVFGLVGVGLFIGVVGKGIDATFHPELAATGGQVWNKEGILWASLTLALLTVPVLIVSTEEALAAVPRSMREGSLACGATRWQTIRRIVLPRALPGIMTGLILAMARGAGEVAPLMLTGAVKLAPDLPFDGTFPYFHLERSFMHLGFHIFDVGFQSPDSEAAKPMVFTTTLLLVAMVAVLNVAAIWLRARLRARSAGGHF
jgi:phosphate transport system permease protein